MKLTDAIKKSGVSAIVYGESGIGKTHFCGTLPGKTLIIAAEANGIKTLSRSANADNIEILYLPQPGKTEDETAAKFNTFFNDLMTGDLDVDNVVLDSATELANLLLLLKADPNRNGGTPTMKNYSDVQFSMRRYLRILRDLAEVRGKNVVVIALEAELVLSQTADASTTKTHPALSGKKLSPEAEGLYDIVAHLEKRTDGVRVLRLEGTESFVAKDRFGRRGCLADGKTLLYPEKEQTKAEPAPKSPAPATPAKSPETTTTEKKKDK